MANEEALDGGERHRQQLAIDDHADVTRMLLSHEHAAVRGERHRDRPPQPAHVLLRHVAFRQRRTHDVRGEPPLRRRVLNGGQGATGGHAHGWWVLPANRWRQVFSARLGRSRPFAARRDDARGIRLVLAAAGQGEGGEERGGQRQEDDSEGGRSPSCGFRCPLAGPHHKFEPDHTAFSPRGTARARRVQRRPLTHSATGRRSAKLSRKKHPSSSGPANPSSPAKMLNRWPSDAKK